MLVDLPDVVVTLAAQITDDELLGLIDSLRILRRAMIARIEGRDAAKRSERAAARQTRALRPWPPSDRTS